MGLEKGLTAVEGIEAVSALGVRGEGLSAGEMLFETYPTQWKFIQARSHVQESDSDSAFTLIKEGGHQTKGEVFACFSC